MISHFSYREKYEEASQQAGDFAGVCMKQVDEIHRLMKMLKKANDLLRSAHQISERDGRETNWRAFQAQVDAALAKQHKTLNDYFAPSDRATEQEGK